MESNEQNPEIEAVQLGDWEIELRNKMREVEAAKKAHQEERATRAEEIRLERMKKEDPEAYHKMMFEQKKAGKAIAGHLEEKTPEERKEKPKTSKKKKLAQKMEELRKKYGIE